ncbi:C4-dicarboxylate TRAP transporter substrate-binding protein [Chachezhania antarctica]|uniref:C4-dicarboxylate TRAP transporter substrate-binding protein n=1 Tax=Chachezhania antarctica TaxID=2340860 RepID=UPI000EB32548|nr:C4-dicarboxylate TRAP transporter substrate-binding protein [Chachezhania antarctica]|tara:strand:- start:818 stop:1951 length:1134 start_codon:yes stop_codon:yes gene_type:complete
MTISRTSVSLAGACTIAASLTIALPGAAAAEELRVATGTASQNGLNSGVVAFAEAFEALTDGKYTTEVYPGTLLKFAEMTNGVRDGIVDIAYTIPAYSRAEFPYTNMVTDVVTASPDVVVMTGVISDYVLNECEPCRDEFRAQNQLNLGFSAVGPYYLMSQEKIASMDDFAGKTMRGVGAFGRYVEAMGAKAVVIPSGDIYESLNQGTLDGNTQGLDTLKSLSYGDVVDYVLNVPIGLYLGSSVFTVNRDLWDGMTEEDKAAMLEAAALGHAHVTVTYYGENQAYLQDPALGGAETVEPDAALQEATEEFYKTEIETVARLAVEKYGQEDAPDRIDAIVALVDKWEAAFEGVDTTDVDAVAQVYYDQLFGKLDPNAL